MISFRQSFPWYFSERGVEEEGAVDILVGCCVDWDRIRGGVEECQLLRGWIRYGHRNRV